MPDGSDKRDAREGYENGIQNNLPEFERTYGIDRCPRYGGLLKKGDPVYKQVTDLDGNLRTVTGTAILEGVAACGAARTSGPAHRSRTASPWDPAYWDSSRICSGSAVPTG